MQTDNSISRYSNDQARAESETPPIEEARELLACFAGKDFAKSSPHEQANSVLSAIRTLFDVVDTNPDSGSSKSGRLAERPYEVLKLRHLGLSTSAIREVLHISDATVRSHDRVVTAYYGVCSYAEAVAVARSRGDV